MNSVSFFITAANLVTWTSYPGFDPEQAVVFGHSSYPAGRSINGGIEIQF